MRVKLTIIDLSELNDAIVKTMVSNDYATIWYNGVEVKNIYIMNTNDPLTCKYRINTAKGQYRHDNPLVEIKHR